MTVRLPRALIDYWKGPPQVELEATTLGETLDRLDERVPGLALRIQDEQGRLRPHVVVFVNGDMIMGREPAAVTLKPGDMVRVVAAVSGG